VPHELRLWWEWHDGSDVEPHELAVNGSFGPSFKVLRIERALEFSRELRQGAEEDAPDDPGSLWASSWLAIGSQGRVACECDLPAEAAVPVLDVDYHKAAFPGALAARSLGEMVSWWIEALELGAWRYDGTHTRWERRPELIPPERDLTGLV
jgi:hypothetical protein